MQHPVHEALNFLLDEAAEHKPRAAGKILELKARLDAALAAHKKDDDDDGPDDPPADPPADPEAADKGADNPAPRRRR